MVGVEKGGRALCITGQTNPPFFKTFSIELHRLSVSASVSAAWSIRPSSYDPIIYAYLRVIPCVLWHDGHRHPIILLRRQGREIKISGVIWWFLRNAI